MSEHVYFADFDVDITAREIRKQGVRIRLRGKPLQILLVLLEQPGEIVPRKYLIERLWAAGTNVEFDSNLKTALSKLRRDLDDSATTPRFIETISGVGFRFLEPVIKKDSPMTVSTPLAQGKTSILEPPNENQQEARAHQSFRHSLAKMGIAAWRRAILAALALLIAGIGVFLPSRNDHTHMLSAEMHNHVVLIIPFEDRSKDAPNDALANDITSEMTNALQAQFPKLAIIAATSASEYKNSRKPLDIISKELGGVDYVLEGVVRRLDKTVNLDVQLVRVADRKSIWTGTFEHNVSDIEAFRRDIPALILESI